MSTVVQNSYRPTLAAGIIGMISDTTTSERSTRLVETAAGIGFGLGCSFGASDKGCVLGGANFLGVSVRDVTLDRLPLDPLALLPSESNAVDAYPKFFNCSIMTRGHIWVKAGANVVPGAAAFYNTTSGIFTNSASGTAANGFVKFTGQPVDGQTITINGVVWTFKNSGAGAAQTNIGPTLPDTLVALAAGLNASADVLLTPMTYAAYPSAPGGGAANQLSYGFDAVGVAGNAIVVTSNVPGTTVTAMSGGTAAATAVPGGFFIGTALAGDPVKLSLGIQK